MEHCNGLSTPNKVELPIGKDDNGTEFNRDWTNSYASDIVMVFYLESEHKTIYFPCY